MTRNFFLLSIFKQHDSNLHPNQIEELFIDEVILKVERENDEIIIFDWTMPKTIAKISEDCKKEFCWILH